MKIDVDKLHKASGVTDSQLFNWLRHGIFNNIIEEEEIYAKINEYPLWYKIKPDVLYGLDTLQICLSVQIELIKFRRFFFGKDAFKLGWLWVNLDNYKDVAVSHEKIIIPDASGPRLLLINLDHYNVKKYFPGEIDTNSGWLCVDLDCDQNVKIYHHKIDLKDISGSRLLLVNLREIAVKSQLAGN